MVIDISVVMPIRNVEATLVEAVDAVLAQEWSGTFEVLLVENRSSDATPTIAAALATRDRRVRVVPALDRDGLAYARHVGIDAAASDRVVICDGDDVVTAGWLAAMADALEHELLGHLLRDGAAMLLLDQIDHEIERRRAARAGVAIAIDGEYLGANLDQRKFFAQRVHVFPMNGRLVAIEQTRPREHVATGAQGT